MDTHQTSDKEEQYKKVEHALKDYFEHHFGEKYSFNTKYALLCAATKKFIPDFGFVGFYVVAPRLDKEGNPTKEEVLEVGSYQSDILPCALIEKGLGVCGTCWEKGTVQVVNDVRKCDNYIACDDVTNAEIVLPVFKSKTDKTVIAVWDIDSHNVNRFEEKDVEHLQKILDYIYM
jgi:L-methionine (R)-S-oxide reductase